MLVPGDDRCHRRDHAGGVAEHLPVVEPHDQIAEGYETLVAQEVAPTIGRFSVMRVTVALDQKSVADEQVGAVIVAGRERRLRGRANTGLMQ